MPPTVPDDPTDVLAALRERVDAAQEAAQRLADEVARERAAAGAGDAASGAAGGGGVPRATQDAASEVQALAAMLEALRGLLPPDLRAQLAEVVRQVLLLVRAVLDWWVARLEPADGAPAPPPPVVQDIPVR
jgi:hypothetical protein